MITLNLRLHLAYHRYFKIHLKCGFQYLFFMQLIKIKPCIVLLLFISNQSFSQHLSKDTATLSTDSMVATRHCDHRLDYKKMTLPAVLVGYGVANLTIDGVKQLNHTLKNEIDKWHPRQTRLDDVAQYVPVVFVYGFNAMGIKGKHNLRDRTIILATSQLIAGVFVFPLKYLTNEQRPDGSNAHSFPSGHTALAFSTARFLQREYKDSNLWLSLSGYPFAVFTGVYRMLNNKHWLGDVVAGAGFGIACTELAYWLYPKINRVLSAKKTKPATTLIPFYQNKTLGLSMVKCF